jgi:hypothetical protein
MRATSCLGLALAGVLLAHPAAAQGNPYPTEVVSDYVFGCMAANGETPDALNKCSCSIDVIASILPYDAYQRGETVLSMRQVAGGGEKMDVFRETAWARTAVEDLRRAQIEAEIRCFG